MWNQVYNPLGNAALSTIAAAIPVVTLLVLIASGKVKAHIAAIIAVVLTNLIAIFIFTMPGNMSIRATLLGVVAGFFPIGWIVLNVIFLYQITVATGKFELLKRAVGGVTEDRRLQLLLIAFSFGAFFEGASGFGTPVAITGSVLIGLGFSPLAASGLSLIANTAPVAYGALGTPIQGLASVTGLDPYILGAMVGRQLPVFSLIVPFWVVWAFAGWKGMKDVWPAILVTGLSFAIPQFVISNYINPWIVDIGASLISMGCLILFLKVWQPKVLWLSPALRGKDESAATMTAPKPMDKTPLGQRGVQGLGKLDLYLQLSRSRPAQHDQQGAAGGREADAGRCRIRVYVPVVHRNRHADRRDHLQRPDGLLAGQDDCGVWPHHQAVRDFADHDLRDARNRHLDAAVGRRRDTGSRIRGDRRAVSLLRHIARLAGRGADRIGYGVEHSVRQSAEDHLGAAGTLVGADGRRQLLRRRDGQDDRRAVDRGRLHRDQLVRTRKHDPALRVQAFDRAGVSRRPARHAAGLCLSFYGDGPEVRRRA